VTDRTNALTIRTDRRLVRSVHHSTRYVVAEITAPPAAGEYRRPHVNVGFVLDRSGSMGGQKISLAKAALREGIERLSSDDRFSVVVYDNVIDLVAPVRAATPDAKSEAIRALDRIDARGNTNLSGGWLRGAEQVALALDPSAVNRVLLLTDGLANEGITDRDELIRHASELRARGIHTSTFGVGSDFDERLLGSMADAGGGAFRFIDKPERIPELIRSEVGELLEVTARSAALRMAGPDGIRFEPLSSFAFDRTLRDGTLHLGDMVADQVLRVIVAISFPLGENGRDIGVEFSLSDAGGALSGSTTLTWTFADGWSNDGQPRDRDVDRVVARTYADRALREAVALNQRGGWNEARELLRSVAKRVRGYAGDDPVLLGIVAELERESEAWAHARPVMEQKLAYAAAEYSLRSRAPQGAAMRVQRHNEPKP
jgi:Ca-activated chloride channel homolog